MLWPGGISSAEAIRTELSSSRKSKREEGGAMLTSSLLHTTFANNSPKKGATDLGIFCSLQSE